MTRGLAAIERGVDMLAQQPARGRRRVRPARAKGRIELRDVSLAYRARTPLPALDRVTLTIEPGESVAPGRARPARGKSTLVNLLPRFIEPTPGRSRSTACRCAELAASSPCAGRWRW